MPRPEPRETVRFTLDLPGDLHRRFRMKAIEEGVHAAVVCRELLDRWVAGADDAMSDDALREAFLAGVRQERARVLAVVTEAAPASRAAARSDAKAGRGGLPTRPPVATPAGTSMPTDVDMPKAPVATRYQPQSTRQ
jgi:hypothetical protein